MKILIGLVLVLFLSALLYPLYSVRNVRNMPTATHPLPNAHSPAVEQELFEHVNHLSVHIGSRSVYEFHKLEAAARYIRDRLEEFGFDPRFQDVAYDGRVYANIVVAVPGRTRPEEIILLGAHYDTVFGTPGADDNASAVAVLLELARFARGLAPERTLKFVFFTLEEPPVFDTPYMGSRVYARKARQEDMDIKAMICLEMVGYFSDQGRQAFPLPLMGLVYPATPDFIAVVGNLRSRKLVRRVSQGLARGCEVPVESLAAFSWVPGIGLSDHSSFWKHGYEAVMITDTAFYRNPNYHRASDTIETLNFKAMAELTRGLQQVILDLDHAPFRQ